MRQFAGKCRAIFTIVFLLLSCHAGAANAAEVDLFASWFEDQTKETGAEKVTISVEGTLPSYIQGNLIRLGPSINHTPTKNYSNFLDGFGRVTKIGFLLSFSTAEISQHSLMTRTGMSGERAAMAQQSFFSTTGMLKCRWAFPFQIYRPLKTISAVSELHNHLELFMMPCADIPNSSYSLQIDSENTAFSEEL